MGKSTASTRGGNAGWRMPRTQLCRMTLKTFLIHYTAVHYRRYKNVVLNWKSIDKLAKKRMLLVSFLLLGQKSWRENASPSSLCLLFACLLLGLFLMNTENPEENKLAANQSIICCLKMSFPLFPPTDLASTAIFTFWKAGKQMLFPYTLLLLWHFLLQKETVQKKTQPFFADKREPADYLGWSLVYHKHYIYHAIPPQSTVISAKLKHLGLFWLNGALPREKDLQILLFYFWESEDRQQPPTRLTFEKKENLLLCDTRTKDTETCFHVWGCERLFIYVRISKSYRNLLNYEMEIHGTKSRKTAFVYNSVYGYMWERHRA